MSRRADMSSIDPETQQGGLLISLLLLVLLAGSLLLAADYLLQPDRFPVRRISFIGEFKHVSKQALQDEASAYIGQNFFVLDLQQMESAMHDIDWIADVDVNRVWPDTLQVSVREQHLIARWNKNQWVTSNSTIVTVPQQSSSGLPQWFGPDGSQDLIRARHAQFGEQMARTGLKALALTYTRRGAWQLVASNQARDERIVIKLGRRDMSERLQRFIRSYQHNLAQQANRLQMVDLRYPNGFALQWNTTTQRRPASAG